MTDTKDNECINQRITLPRYCKCGHADHVHQEEFHKELKIGFLGRCKGEFCQGGCDCKRFEVDKVILR